jgi:glycosyltransferase involved in cell wall biosynthesis
MFSRILIVSPTDSFSGAGQFRHDLAVGLQRNGFSVTIAQPAENTQLQSHERALAIHHEFFSTSPYEDPAGFVHDKYGAAEIICRARPDLIIFTSGLFFCAHRSYLQGAQYFQIPYIFVEHLVDEVLFKLPERFRPEFETYYRQAKAVVAVSNETLRVLRKQLALPEHVGRVILCGRPEEFFAPRSEERRRALRAEWKIPEDALAVVTVAKLEPVKRHDLIIRALERMKSRALWNRVYFIWIGDGSQRAQLGRDLSKAGVQDHVRMLGFRWDVASLYDGCDIFALLSYSEGLPLSVMESMAKGLPPLCTDAGGTAEGIADAGIVFANPREPQNEGRVVEGFVAALERLAGDPALLQSLAGKARGRARALFTEQRMMRDYITLIGDVAKQEQGKPPQAG